MAEEFILLDAKQPAAKIEWAVYTFIAKGVKKVADISPDSGEKIKLISVTIDELIELPLRKDIYFAEQEIVSMLLEARINPEKKKELQELFSPLK